jgi:hypothetical protein
MYSSVGNWDHPHNHFESTRQPVGEIARCRPASGMAVSAIVICGSGDIGSYLILHIYIYIIDTLHIIYILVYCVYSIEILILYISMNRMYTRVGHFGLTIRIIFPYAFKMTMHVAAF